MKKTTTMLSKMLNSTIYNETSSVNVTDSDLDRNLLTSKSTDELVWLIPTVIVVIVLLFLTALGLFHCCVGIGECCLNCCSDCGCYKPKRRRALSEERLRLTEHPLPIYESSADTDSASFPMTEVNRFNR